MTRRTRTIATTVLRTGAAVLLLAGAPAGCQVDASGGGPDGEHLGVSAQRVGSPPDHYWALDEASGTNAIDSGAPGGVPGTLGATATRFFPGRVGAGAVHLPGGSAASVIGFGSTVGKVGTGDFTATFWMRSTQSTTGELLGNRGCGSACNFWGLRASSSSVGFEIYQDAAGTNGGGVNVPVNAKNGQWHYVAARRSGKTLTLFVDGVSGSYTAVGVADITTSTALSFGNSPIASIYGILYVGDVDEIRLYDRALADCEILGSPVVCSPSDPCHAGATCDILTGICSDPPLADGTACDDGDACTTGDACVAGTCSGQGGDPDGDGLVGSCDDCPTVWNPSQADSDGNGVGDACQTQCVTLRRDLGSVVQDTYIVSGTGKNDNYGASATALVGVSGTLKAQALLSFDLSGIPAAALLSSADVTMKCTGATVPMSSYQVLAPWDEATVTYASFNGASAGTAEATFASCSGGTTSFSVLALAQRWVNGTAPSYGVLLRQLTSSTTLRTSEASSASARPQLTVCFTIPG